MKSFKSLILGFSMVCILTAAPVYAMSGMSANDDMSKHQINKEIKVTDVELKATANKLVSIFKKLKMSEDTAHKLSTAIEKFSDQADQLTVSIDELNMKVEKLKADKNSSKTVIDQNTKLIAIKQKQLDTLIASNRTSIDKILDAKSSDVFSILLYGEKVSKNDKDVKTLSAITEEVATSNVVKAHGPRTILDHALMEYMDSMKMKM